MIKRKKIVQSDKDNLVYNKWIDCSNDNYWQTDRDMCSVILGGEMYYICKNDCPYDWKFLVKNHAQFFTPIEQNLKAHFKNG